MWKRKAARVLGAALLVGVLAWTSRPPKIRSTPTGVPPMLAREELLRTVGRPVLNLLADYYWIQTIQTAGIAHDQWTYRDIYAFGDMATQLDPDFRYVYQFTATAVTYNLGRETWVNTDESTAILEKGLRRFPNDLRLRTIYAFNLSYFHGRYAEAAQVLTDTINLPGAPKYLGGLATRLYAQGGKVESGLALARSMYESTDDPEQREQIGSRIQELLLERELQQVDAAVQRFLAREKRVPTLISELVIVGDLKNDPVDPLGGRIYLDEKGRAASTSQDRRLEIYRENTR